MHNLPGHTASLFAWNEIGIFHFSTCNLVSSTMANITLYNGLNLNSLRLYDFISEDLASISTTRIVYDLPFNASQIYTGFFEIGINGNVTPESQITAIDSVDGNNNALWSISGLNLPVSVYETYVDDDAIVGTNDSEELITYMLRSDDQVAGSDQNDRAVLFAGNDSFVGFEGNDTVNGHFGNDMLNGHSGDDLVRGGADNDTVRGGAGDDIVMGDKGNDDILGDMGDDTLYGGEGADRFIFKAGSGSDVIVDFDASDTLVIYMRASVQDVNDIDIDVSNGDTIVNLGFGEDITLLNYEQLTAADIMLV
jgi:Ca2+-binding RTX toxin-like protein